MTALAIALHVLVVTAAPGPRLETPLALRLETAQPARPDLAPPPIALRPAFPDAIASERPLHVLGVRPGPWAAGAGATAFVDTMLVGAIVVSVAHGTGSGDQLFGDGFIGGPVLAPAAGLAYLIVPPLVAAWGAEKAGAPRGRHGDVWASATAARFLGAGAAFALAALARGIERSDGPQIDERQVLVGALAFSELVAMPWVVARTLADVPEAETPADPAETPPATRARPVLDPALAIR